MPQTQQALLGMVQQATAELGIDVPSAVASSQDPQVIQLFALMKRALRELQQSYPWLVLTRENIIEVGVPLDATGDVVEGSFTISNVTPTTGITANSWIVTGTNIPQAARVASIVGSTVTMTMEATGTQVGSTLAFIQDTYAVSSDFDYFIGNTWWDRTNRWQLLGPDSPQIDQYHRSGIVQTGPRLHWRQIGQYFTNFRLWPQPSALPTPLQLVFEYVSSNAVMLGGSTTNLGPTFVSDTDVPLLDSNALILDLKWRWLQIKRMMYADIQAEALDYIDRLKARDGGSAVLSLSPNMGPDYLISPANVPDGNYPS